MDRPLKETPESSYDKGFSHQGPLQRIESLQAKMIFLSQKLESHETEMILLREEFESRETEKKLHIKEERTFSHDVEQNILCIRQQHKQIRKEMDEIIESIKKKVVNHS